MSPPCGYGDQVGEIAQALFGEDIADLRYYWLREYHVDGIPVVVSRTGWSSELGCKIYLLDGSRGGDLWEAIMAAGQPSGSSPSHFHHSPYRRGYAVLPCRYG